MTKVIVTAALLSLPCLAVGGCQEAERSASSRLDEALAPPAASAPARDGVAAAVVIDVSGSMDDRAREGGDGGKPKIQIARRAARDLVAQFVRYAKDHPQETVLVGVYEFSRRNHQPDCRPVIPMGAPDLAKAALAIDAMRPEGGTPIGSAMIEAKRELDRTGLSRRHLLLITDGENTSGASPAEVMAALARRPVTEQPSVYFVAFDIEADRFQSVRDAGALVMAAANATQLDTTLDTLLRGKILVER